MLGKKLTSIQSFFLYCGLRKEFSYFILVIVKGGQYKVKFLRAKSSFARDTFPFPEIEDETDVHSTQNGTHFNGVFVIQKGGVQRQANIVKRFTQLYSFYLISTRFSANVFLYIRRVFILDNKNAVCLYVLHLKEEKFIILHFILLPNIEIKELKNFENIVNIHPTSCTGSPHPPTG